MTAPFPSLDSMDFTALEQLLSAQEAPLPLDSWHPPYCGHSRMRIDARGGWWHEERPITRPALVKLFQSILRREENGQYMLVTPVEKMAIDVERTPLRVISINSDGEGPERRMMAALDNGKILAIGPEHPLFLYGEGLDLSPRLSCHHGLEAEVARSSYYELMNWAIAEGHDPIGLYSHGQFFRLDGQ